MLATRAAPRVASKMPTPDTPVQPDARRVGGAALTGAGLAVIAWATLRAHPALAAMPALACCSLYDSVLNTLLFLPVGAGLVLLGFRLRSAVVIGTLVSIAIELAQHWWIVGRFSSVADVVANSAGTLLGALIVWRWASRAHWWPRVALIVAPTIVLLWLLGGQVVQPAIPGPTAWRVVRPDSATGAQARSARALAATLQGFPLPDGAVADLPALRALLAASDTVRVTATLVSGEVVPDFRSLLEIVVGEGTTPFLVLGQQDGSLLAYQRLGLSWVGLRGPWLSVAGVLEPPAGDTVRVELTATRSDMRLVASRAGIEHSSRVRLSPELYLSALFNRATDGVLWWGLVPALCSFVLLGLSLANRPRWLAISCLFALVVSARAGGSAYPAWPVLSLAMLGAWLGLRAGRALELFDGG